MKLFLIVAVLVSVLAAVSANIFGANNALNKQHPGSKPIGVNDYNKLVQQQEAQRPPATPSSNPNWMFEPTTPPAGGRRQNSRPRVPSQDSDEQDISGEED